MDVKKIVSQQYRNKVNAAVKLLGAISMPPEGWVRTMRNALGMSGLQLAHRVSVTKARISRVEHDELRGNVTLKSMQSMAKAMNCRFVYAIVPEQEVESLIKKQATEKAREQVAAASAHMALEAQTLSDEMLGLEVERIAKEIIEKMPSDLWNDS